MYVAKEDLVGLSDDFIEIRGLGGGFALEVGYLVVQRILLSKGRWSSLTFMDFTNISMFCFANFKAGSFGHADANGNNKP